MSTSRGESGKSGQTLTASNVDSANLTGSTVTLNGVTGGGNDGAAQPPQEVQQPPQAEGADRD